MKRRKYRHNKKPTEAQQKQVELAGRPAFGQPAAAVTKPEPNPVAPVIVDEATAAVSSQDWSPDGGVVNPVSYTPNVPISPDSPVRHSLSDTPPPPPRLQQAPPVPLDRIGIELYVENSTLDDIILRHVTADDISVLVENSVVEPGQTRRVLMILTKPGEEEFREDGFMFCQGQAKNQCVVRCRGKTLWVALQSGAINPQMHDMTAFSNTSFTGQRYLLCFKPPFRSH